MAAPAPLQGELQIHIISAMWRIGSGTVEDVQEALPARYRSTYNTVQAVRIRLGSAVARARSVPFLLIARQQRHATSPWRPLIVAATEALDRRDVQAFAVRHSFDFLYAANRQLA